MTVGVLGPPPIPRLDALARRPTSAMPEATLLHGYRAGAADRRPCGCGVDISVYPGDDIATVVGGHNRSPEHEAWAIANGWRDG